MPLDDTHGSGATMCRVLTGFSAWVAARSALWAVPQCPELVPRGSFGGRPVGPSCDPPPWWSLSGMGRLQQCFAFLTPRATRERCRRHVGARESGFQTERHWLLAWMSRSVAKRRRASTSPVARRLAAPSQNVICDKMLRGRGPAPRFLSVRAGHATSLQAMRATFGGAEDVVAADAPGSGRVGEVPLP